MLSVNALLILYDRSKESTWVDQNKALCSCTKSVDVARFASARTVDPKFVTCFMFLLHGHKAFWRDSRMAGCVKNAW